MVYAYHVQNLSHTEGCVPGERCAPKCRWAEYHNSLDAPLHPWEIEAEERYEQRLRVLLSGEIPT